jgi:ABC-type polysaccharide/polyol phosphate export permease
MIARAHEYDSAARRPRVVEELLDLLSNGPLVFALVQRDITVRYKRSVFGVLWTMLNPAAMLLVFTLAFSSIFSAHAPGYAFFVVPGLLLWNFFAQTTSVVAREVAIGVDLWRRIRVPKSALVASTLLTGLINVVLAVGPLLLVLIVARRPLGAALLTLPLTVALVALFVLGVSLILGAIAVYFPDVADLYGVLLPAVMFTAPIAYPAAIVSPGLQSLLRLNPITHFVEAFRAPLYANAAPAPIAFATMAVVALVTVVVGWFLFTRSTDDIPYRI